MANQHKHMANLHDLMAHYLHYNRLLGYGNEPCAHEDQPFAYANQPYVCLFAYANEISLQVRVRELPLIDLLVVMFQGHTVSDRQH